jgi:hypothetical protein
MVGTLPRVVSDDYRQDQELNILPNKERWATEHKDPEREDLSLKRSRTKYRFSANGY